MRSLLLSSLLVLARTLQALAQSQVAPTLQPVLPGVIGIAGAQTPVSPLLSPAQSLAPTLSVGGLLPALQPAPSLISDKAAVPRSAAAAPLQLALPQAVPKTASPASPVQKAEDGAVSTSDHLKELAEALPSGESPALGVAFDNSRRLPSEDDLFTGSFGRSAGKTTRSILSPADSRSWGLENVPDSRYADELKKAAQALKETHRRRRTPSLLALYGRIWRFDRSLYYHMVRVGLMAARLALAMGSSESYAQDLSRAARLHDVGKMDPEVHAVISKPGRLTPEERTLMESHPEKGEQTLSRGSARPGRRWRRMAARIARSHHEAFDGSGYPDKLRGTKIPFEARITAVVDVFDALMENRPYRPGMKMEEALAIMEKERSRFDPAVYRAFLDELSAQDGQPED
ncbi:MAG: HD domain-containing phosphohydrolase [Elusimicrobiota bacterium]